MLPTIVRRTSLLLVVLGAALLLGCEEMVPTKKDDGPSVPPTPDFVTTEEVHEISAAQLDDARFTVEPHRLSFSQPVAYAPGEFIAAGISDKTPYGVLRRVVSVSADRRTVTTADATLGEVIERGRVRIKGVLTPEDLNPASRAALRAMSAGREASVRGDGGNGALTPQVMGEAANFVYGVSVSDGDLTVSGEVNLRLTYELDANYDFGLKDLLVSFTSQQGVSLTVTSEGAVSMQRQIGPTLYFTPIPIPGLPFSAAFTPSLEFSVGVNGNFRASVTAEYSNSLTVGARCARGCTSRDSWDTFVETGSPAEGGSIETSAEGELSVFAESKLAFDLLGRFGGPHLKVTPYIRATAEKKAGEECPLLVLAAGVRGAIGGEATFLGRVLLMLADLVFAIVDPRVLWEKKECECPSDWNTFQFDWNDTDAISACLDAGSDVNARGDSGRTPLHHAASVTNDPDAIRVLAEAGAEVNARDDDGFTPLHYAAHGNDSIEVIKALLRAGADVLAPEHIAGFTPLHSAAVGNDNPEVIFTLTDAGADANARAHGGLTPLHAWVGRVDAGATTGVMRALLAAGADIHAGDINGATPLHYAALLGYDAAQALLDAGADPDARSDIGATPLHFAAPIPNNADMITLLVNAGANVNAQGTGGLTPLDVATSVPNNQANIQALLAAGATCGAGRTFVDGTCRLGGY